MGGEGSQKLLLRRGFAPLRSDSRHPVQRKLNTLPQAHPLWFSASGAQLVRAPPLASPLPALAKLRPIRQHRPACGTPLVCAQTKDKRTPVFLSFVTSWLHLFPRAVPFRCNLIIPPRGCVLRLTAGTPLPSINGIVAPRGAA